jgi:hypothetical protein
MLATLLAAIIAVSGHAGAPMAQVHACETSVISAINAGHALKMSGAIGHNCGARASLSHKQARDVASYLTNWVSRH